MEDVKDLELTAVIPSEMVASQQQLIAWCEKKIVFTRGEALELEEAEVDVLELTGQSIRV